MKVAIWGRGRVAQAVFRECVKKNINAETVGREGVWGRHFDVVIDFSSAEAIDSILGYCLDRNVPLVIGTTGYNFEQFGMIKSASKKLPIVLENNFSLGVFALKKAAEILNICLSGWDKNILEIHRKDKKDAPSGTGKTLGELVNCNVVSLRQGDNFGEHYIYFEGDNERICLSHTAYSREIFARGAVFCAEKIIGMDNGLYSLKDFM